MSLEPDVFGALEDAAPVAGCFLCLPDPSLIFDESDHFFVMLGLGPIVEGYSIIAAKDHVSSMLDLHRQHAEELSDFSLAVRARLCKQYGPTTITEHGRVAPCVTPQIRAYETHCLHAHRLVFPGISQISIVRSSAITNEQRYDDYLETWRRFDDPRQYLFSERATLECDVASVRGPITRQYFRRLAAFRVGTPDLADWRTHPGYNTIAAAKERLT
jgi:diadenosine tetraphosphate (Ap4A) HIT family hydrolase